MNKIKRSIVIVMLFSLIATKCSAITTIEENSNMYILEELEAPYHYLNEGKADGKIRSLNGNLIYALGKYDDSDNETVTNGTQYVNEEINHILENGYPMQMESTLGCINWKEAYFATQEAIYCKLENKDVDKYIAENEAGQRIINAVKKILRTPKKEEITLLEMTDWNSLSDTEKGKEYDIICCHEVPGYGVKIIEANARIVYRNGTKFRVVVPKDSQKPISIKIEVDIICPYVQICSSKDSAERQYVMVEVGRTKKDKQFKINVTDAQVKIKNRDENYNAIVGSSFDILDLQYHTIKENLQTDNLGNIQIGLDKGKYYLKQKNVQGEYEINKALIEIDIQDSKEIDINVINTPKYYETSITKQKEIHTTEETKHIQEINQKEVTNIHTMNINKEIINEINETNLNNVNHFINTINRRNIQNLNRENVYKNWIDEFNKQDRILEGENINLAMTRSDYMNHIDMLMYGKTTAPILPVASKQNKLK